MTRPTRLPLALLLLAAAAACATTSREGKLRRELDGHRYPRTVEEIWLEVQKLVEERGYPLSGSDRAAVGAPSRSRLLDAFSPGFDTRARSGGGRILESNADGGGFRMRAEAWPAGRGCQVRFTRLKRDDTNPANHAEVRDLELELELLRRADPAAAAAAEGVPPQAAAPAAAAYPWQPVRHLLGTWEAEAGGGRPALTWAFAFAPGGQRLELRGSPILGAAGPEEMGVLTRDPASGKLFWRQFTASGQVNEYLEERSDADRLVFATAKAEALPEGARARLTLGRDGADELVAVFERAEPGKPFAVRGESRLRRRK